VSVVVILFCLVAIALGLRRVYHMTWGRLKFEKKAWNSIQEESKHISHIMKDSPVARLWRGTKYCCGGKGESRSCREVWENGRSWVRESLLFFDIYFQAGSPYFIHLEVSFVVVSFVLQLRALDQYGRAGIPEVALYLYALAVLVKGSGPAVLLTKWGYHKFVLYVMTDIFVQLIFALFPVFVTVGTYVNSGRILNYSPFADVRLDRNVAKADISTSLETFFLGDINVLQVGSFHKARETRRRTLVIYAPCVVMWGIHRNNTFA
jgi:hypothetical protein